MYVEYEEHLHDFIKCEVLLEISSGETNPIANIFFFNDSDLISF